MDKKKNVTLLCMSFRFSKIEFSKPPFCIMKAIQRKYNCDCKIVYDKILFPYYYQETSEIDFEDKDGVKLLCLSSENDSKSSVIQKYDRYIVENAKDIDVLIFFHGDRNEAKTGNLYKKFNPKGKLITIMDFSSDGVKKSPVRILKSIAKRILKCKMFSDYKKYEKNCDLFSVETIKSYNYLKNHKWQGIDFSKSDKLQIHPFGYNIDQNLLDFNDIQKENLIITVGRIGSYPKNSEMILDALKNVELKNWKFVFVGPIEEKFEKEIQQFYIDYPQKKDSVICVGAINDRAKLVEYYKKSKVFVLSSLREGCPLVLIESKLFNNFILTTPVGSAYDIVKSNSDGKIFNDRDELCNILNDIICGKMQIADKSYINSEVAKKYSWDNIVSDISLFSDILCDKFN